MRPFTLVCRIGLFAGAGLILGGCQNPATKMTDADLAALLGGGQDISADTIDCLRAWSGDSALAQGLSADYSGPRKQDCRRTIESWLPVAERNPHKVGFDNLAAPEIVGRAVAIQQQQQVLAEQRAQAAAAEKKHAAEVAATLVRKRAATARITSLGAEFNGALGDLRAACARAEEATKHKRRVPENLQKQIDGCSAKADAQQQQWSDAVSRNDLAAATLLLKAAHESVTGAKSLAANAAKVRR